MEKKTHQPVKEIQVKLKFEGVVTVTVPRNARLPEVLAQKIALSRALATIDNPDAPDEDASSEWIDALDEKFGEIDEDKALEIWDKTQVKAISGTWCLNEN